MIKLNVEAQCSSACAVLKCAVRTSPSSFAGVDIRLFTRMAQEIAQAEGIDLEELECPCHMPFIALFSLFVGHLESC